MVDVLGHLGMAMVWLAPAWYFIDRQRTAAVFVDAGFCSGCSPTSTSISRTGFRT